MVMMLNKTRKNIGRIPLRYFGKCYLYRGLVGWGGSFLQRLFDNPLPHIDHPLHSLPGSPPSIHSYICVPILLEMGGGVGTTTSLFWVGCFPLPLLPLPPTCSVVPYHFPYPPPSTHPLWSSSFVYLHFTC